MLHNKQKMICHTLIIALTIVILGFSSYSSVFALPVIHHHKVFDKKQDSGSNSKDARSDGSGSRPSSSSDKTDDHLQISSSHSSDSSSSSDTKSSDNTNNVDNAITNKNNNDQSTNDGSNTGADNNLHSVEPAKTGEQQQQGSGENSPLIGTATPTPTPQTTCEQASNCTDQQGLSDHDRSTTDTTTTKQDNMPFVLPVPFP